MSHTKLALVLGLLFFVVGVATLPHYGINWDTINHLPRGQAYLHYFLTGKKDFSDLPPWRPYWQKPESLFLDTDIPKDQISTRSIYQSDGTTFTWFLENERGGHPPLSDILSSVFNRLLFGKLKLINDIDAYRVYGIFLSGSLVVLLFWWTAKLYGRFAGLVAALSVSLYPLFWAESHFNTEKDIPETVFWSFMLFAVWKGISGSSWRWILMSGIFFGLALGTKFNILFSIFVILPWLFALLIQQYIKGKVSIRKFISKNLKLSLATFAAPIIGFGIFLGSWPYLWPDPILRIGKIVSFYKTIGLTSSIDERFMGPLGINTYPLQWILYTTPLIILLFTIVGIIAALYRWRTKGDQAALLLFLWLLVPIARVAWPGATVYGGIRQIMEYIPAMAMLAGLGAVMIAGFTQKWFKKRIFIRGLLLLAFLPLVAKLIAIHPNANVYFNELIGGLQGAKERNFPAWGNSFGAPYRQAVSWINHNVPQGSKVVLVNELLPNIPHLFFRRDLTFHNSNRSGYLRQGEYAITLIYQGVENRSYYDKYLETFIEPVYQATVDGVPILKVWKNDEQHLKVTWREDIAPDVQLQTYDNGLKFDLSESKRLSRLEIYFNEKNCELLTSGYVRISNDGSTWEALPGVMPRYWKVSVLGPQPSDGRFIEPFAGEEARFIEIVTSPINTCLKNVKRFNVFYFQQ